MPLRNRVTPFSELVADPARGLVYGNRGCLHDEHGAIRRRFAVRRWIACRLEFRGWQRSPLLQPGKFTELFFLDEATAFAAGHRPCALCRYEDYRAFVTLWHKLHASDPSAPTRSTCGCTPSGSSPGRGRSAGTRPPYAELPDGAFVVEGEEPLLVLGDRLLHWTPGGYDGARPRPRSGTATVLTPPSLVAVLASGWEGVVPLLHPTAAAQADSLRGPA